MKKAITFSLLGLLACAALAAPAQAYYPQHDRHDRFERDHFNWQQQAPYFRDRDRMMYQQHEQYEWRIHHPFLSLF